MIERFEAFVGVNFWTALFVLGNTLIIFFVAKKYLFGPVMKLIRERQQEIDGMYCAADSARSSAMTMQAQYAQKLSAAAQTGERIVKEAVARGQRREEEIIRSANAEAAAIRDKAAADIAREKRKAVNDARAEISDMAIAIAEKVVSRKLNETDQAKLVEDFISGLEDLP